jgi:hypothetical protein
MLPRVAKIALSGSDQWSLGIAQIHVLPGNFVNRINTLRAQKAPDWPHQSPRRQSIDQRRCTDEVSLDKQSFFLPLDADLFYAPDFPAVYIMHFRAHQELDSNVHCRPLRPRFQECA